jgi:PAS domain-containing protein
MPRHLHAQQWRGRVESNQIDDPAGRTFEVNTKLAEVELAVSADKDTDVEITVPVISERGGGPEQDDQPEVLDRLDRVRERLEARHGDHSTTPPADLLRIQHPEPGVVQSDTHRSGLVCRHRGRRRFSLSLDSHTPVPDGVLAAATQVLQHPGVPLPVEYRTLHKDGSWRWVETRDAESVGEPECSADCRQHARHNRAQAGRRRAGTTASSVDPGPDSTVGYGLFEPFVIVQSVRDRETGSRRHSPSWPSGW